MRSRAARLFLILLPLVAFALLLRGWLQQPAFELVQVPAMRIIYRDENIPFRLVHEKFTQFAVTHKVERFGCTKFMAQYFDNPWIVPDNEMRVRIGCLVDTFPATMPEGMQGLTLPARTYVRYERGTIYSLTALLRMIQIAIFIERHHLLRSGPFTELYDMRESKVYMYAGGITVLVPVAEPLY